MLDAPVERALRDPDRLERERGAQRADGRSRRRLPRVASRPSRRVASIVFTVSPSARDGAAGREHAVDEREVGDEPVDLRRPARLAGGDREPDPRAASAGSASATVEKYGPG